MTDNNETNVTEPSSARPAASFTGTGGLHVAIWKNRTENDQEVYSVKIDRRYKDDKDGEFKSTQYLRAGDLLRAQKLLEQADYWIEADKQRSRVASAGQNTR